MSRSNKGGKLWFNPWTKKTFMKNESSSTERMRVRDAIQKGEEVINLPRKCRKTFLYWKTW